MRLRGSALGLSALVLAAAAVPCWAQDPLRDGTLLIHGNYCGPGNRGYRRRPVDALDAACRRHDLCTPDGDLPSCRCNARLASEAARVARDPRQPRALRDLAQVVADSAQIPICRP